MKNYRKKLSISLLLIISIICSALTGLNARTNPVSAASVDNSAAVSDTLTEQEFVPSSDNVKLLGRTYLLDNTLWCAFSGTGIEFTFTGTKADITLIGDNIATASWGDGHYCRFGIYVNDKLVSDELLKKAQETITAFSSAKEQTVTVRVMKLTESSDSTLGIGTIKVTAKGAIKSTPAKAHRIEFIGDSITCGFGVDDSDRNGQYTTATEDFTKTYAYKTAQLLNVDYSVAAFSGYGIISGYTQSGIQNKNQLVSSYYNKMGFSYGNFNSNVKVDSIDWDFNRYVPDVIVINLGTNDYSYCKDVKIKKAEKKKKQFVKGYVAFLKQVRKANPDATIICTVGIMGAELYPSIESAAKQYTKATKDKKVYTMQFDVQQISDGICACWHPSEKTHAKAAKKLTAEIKKIMKW